MKQGQKITSGIDLLCEILRCGLKPATLWLVGFCFLAALLIIPHNGLCRDEADKALALVRETYSTLEGLKADFVQTEERPGVGVSVREDGVLSFSPPDAGHRAKPDSAGDETGRCDLFKRSRRY
jgi:hypothetical protein